MKTIAHSVNTVACNEQEANVYNCHFDDGNVSSRGVQEFMVENAGMSMIFHSEVEQDVLYGFNEERECVVHPDGVLECPVELSEELV